MATKRTDATKASRADYVAVMEELGRDEASLQAADAYLATTHAGTGEGSLAWAANPFVLSAERYAALGDAARTLSSIMEKVMAKYQRDASFRALFGFTREVEELTLVPTGCHAAVPFARADLFLGDAAKDFQLCGIVTGGVSGMTDSVEVARAIQGTETARELSRRGAAAHATDAVQECAATLLNTYVSWANAQEGRNHPTKPSLAVVDVAGSVRARETADVIARLRELGCYAHVASFDELRVAEVGGQTQLVDAHGPVTCVWLRATADEALAAGDGIRTLLAATRRGLVCTVGGYRSWPCCTRAFLEVLRTPECQELLSAEENAFVEAHIPETHVLSTASDLSDFYDQQRWVLRQADGNRAADIVAGTGMSKAAWRNRLVKGIKLRDAVQAYVAPQPGLAIPGGMLPEGEKREAHEVGVMTSLFVFGGSLAGVGASCGTGETIAQWSDRLEMGVLVEG